MDTKQGILDTAERLFAQNGIDATSLRSITSEANVNLAAVNYHYGSKEVLVQEVFRRRIQQVNEERLKMLARFQSEAGGRPLQLEKILDALLAPLVRLCLSGSEQDRSLSSLMHRAFNEPNENLMRFIMGELREVIVKFTEALSRALPDLSARDLHWRLNFAIGATVHSLLVIPRLLSLHGCSECSAKDFNADALLQNLIPFIAGGLRVPPARSEKD